MDARGLVKSEKKGWGDGIRGNKVILEFLKYGVRLASHFYFIF